MKKIFLIFLTCICASPWAWAIFFKETHTTFCLCVSNCWRCDANWRTQNVLPFLRHKENAKCYGKCCKQCSL